VLTNDCSFRAPGFFAKAIAFVRGPAQTGPTFQYCIFFRGDKLLDHYVKVESSTSVYEAAKSLFSRVQALGAEDVCHDVKLVRLPADDTRTRLTATEIAALPDPLLPVR
jgi:hypothetical protein